MNKKIEDLQKEVNKIASDKALTVIEKKVKIAIALSGKYKGKNGEITVYRSPDNRTLLAVKGKFKNITLHQINVKPADVLNAIKNI